MYCIDTEALVFMFKDVPGGFPKSDLLGVTVALINNKKHVHHGFLAARPYLCSTSLNYMVPKKLWLTLLAYDSLNYFGPKSVLFVHFCQFRAWSGSFWALLSNLTLHRLYQDCLYVKAIPFEILRGDNEKFASSHIFLLGTTPPPVPTRYTINSLMSSRVLVWKQRGGGSH